MKTVAHINPDHNRQTSHDTRTLRSGYMPVITSQLGIFPSWSGSREQPGRFFSALILIHFLLLLYVQDSNETRSVPTGSRWKGRNPILQQIREKTVGRGSKSTPSLRVHLVQQCSAWTVVWWSFVSGRWVGQHLRGRKGRDFRKIFIHFENDNTYLWKYKKKKHIN